MSNHKELTPVQKELLLFFAPSETPGICKNYRTILETVLFNSDFTLEGDGRDTVYSLYYLIKLLENKP